MQSNIWPDTTIPIGMFVGILSTGLKYYEFSPMQKRVWREAWKRKSKWYRSRLKTASSEPLAWAKELDINLSQKEIWEMWIRRGDDLYMELMND